MIQDLDHTADRVANFMKIDKIQTEIDLMTLGTPEMFTEKTVSKILRQEFKKLGGLHFEFMLFETLMAWSNQETYESPIFEHFEKYSMLAKLGYKGTQPNYKIPVEFAKEHKRMWQVYNLDRFASELELVYADQILRYYINQ